MTDQPQGTGLGLPISRQIIEHFGGRLWVESAPGEGATFVFELPAAARRGRATGRRPAAQRMKQHGADMDRAPATRRRRWARRS